MTILIAKKDLQFNTLDILDAKVVEPLDHSDLVEFFAESIHFARVERHLDSDAGIASAIITDLIQANMLVIQKEVPSA